MELVFERARDNIEYRQTLRELYLYNYNQFVAALTNFSREIASQLLEKSFLASIWVFPLFKTWALTTHQFEQSPYFQRLGSTEQLALKLMSLPVRIEEVVSSGWPEYEKQKREAATQMLTREAAYQFTHEERIIPVEVKDCVDCPKQIQFTKATYKHSLFHFSAGLDPLQ